MSSRVIVITQSNYIPWKGYFDAINLADDFVIYDEMQFTKRDWRNRNKIKTPQGASWLTVPVVVKGRFDQKICETEIAEPSWADQHWRTISQNYARAPYFKDYKDAFEELYRGRTYTMLTELNVAFLTAICGMLGIKTRFHSSSDFTLAEERTERLVNICRDLGGTKYMSGPAAKAYMDEGLFANAGIDLEYFDYSGYIPYRQLYGDFVHEVSIIDLIFNEGPDAPRYLKTLAAVINDGPTYDSPR